MVDVETFLARGNFPCSWNMNGNNLDVEKVSHVEAMKEIRRLMCELMSDPFLNDLSPRASAEDVASVLAVEQGRAITVHLRRFDSLNIRTSYLLTVLYSVL